MDRRNFFTTILVAASIPLVPKEEVFDLDFRDVWGPGGFNCFYGVSGDPEILCRIADEMNDHCQWDEVGFNIFKSSVRSGGRITFECGSGFQKSLQQSPTLRAAYDQFKARGAQ